MIEYKYEDKIADAFAKMKELAEQCRELNLSFVLAICDDENLDVDVEQEVKDISPLIKLSNVLYNKRC